MDVCSTTDEEGRENRKFQQIISSLLFGYWSGVGNVRLELILCVCVCVEMRVFTRHTLRGMVCFDLWEWCRLYVGVCRYGCSTVCLFLPYFCLLPFPFPPLLPICLFSASPLFLLAPSSHLPYISVSPPCLPPQFALTHWTEVALLPCTVIGCLPDAGWAKQHSSRAAGAAGPQCTTAHRPPSSFIPPPPPPLPQQPATTQLFVFAFPPLPSPLIFKSWSAHRVTPKTHNCKFWFIWALVLWPLSL